VASDAIRTTGAHLSRSRGAARQCCFGSQLARMPWLRPRGVSTGRHTLPLPSHMHLPAVTPLHGHTDPLIQQAADLLHLPLLPPEPCLGFNHAALMQDFEVKDLVYGNVTKPDSYVRKAAEFAGWYIHALSLLIPDALGQG